MVTFYVIYISLMEGIDYFFQATFISKMA